MSKIPTNTQVPLTQTQNQGQLHPMQMKHAGGPLTGEPSTGHIYLSGRANPFIPSGGSNLWHRNELLLQDDSLRARAGVIQIDDSLTRGYGANPEKSRY